MDKKSILILGAGPAGMSAAFELNKAKIKFTLVEKSGQVGGLAKTYQFKNFLTDNGPHRFYSKNKYLYDLIGGLLGEKWKKVDRSTRFYIKGKFFKYPVELKDTLSKLGFQQSLGMFFDYIVEKFKFLDNPKNFKEYAVSTFGKSLAEFNILNYTEKIWGLECSQLSVEWGKQRISDLSISSLLKNSIFKAEGPKTLVQQFYYPSKGTGSIYQVMKEKIEKNNEISLNTEPISIIHKEGQISKVSLSNHKSYDICYLISSMPITSFVSLLHPKPPRSVIDAMKKLRYRSQVYLFLTIDRPSITPDQWIYFPDKEIPFARISEMRNFSKQMSPRNKTSLFIEFFCWKGDEIWNKTKEELFDTTIMWLEKLKFLKREDIMEVFHFKGDHVYPVYDIGYEKHLKLVKDYLDTFSNLIYIGRPGRFKYTNQDHSLEMGILAARSVIEGKKYQIGKIGSENEYFERGYVS